MNIEIENPKPIEIDNDVKMYRGPRGYSSYEIALQNGFRGTEKDFLNSLKGKDGEPGLKGDPFTYNDFTKEQLETLKGPKGDTGLKGEKGDKGETGPQGPQGEKGDTPDLSEYATVDFVKKIIFTSITSALEGEY